MNRVVILRGSAKLTLELLRDGKVWVGLNDGRLRAETVFDRDDMAAIKVFLDSVTSRGDAANEGSN